MAWKFVDWLSVRSSMDTELELSTLRESNRQMAIRLVEYRKQVLQHDISVERAERDKKKSNEQLLVVKRFWERLVEDVRSILQSCGIAISPPDTFGTYQLENAKEIDPYLARLAGKDG